ncbi:MAG: chaperonin family protein RbcX [Leptolyngbyaceae cyanobacterium MO_188.B28]|nr:chaperonin family protein RbcX [Leptolyngbyaceae cyanobacterium MO_188.B28]
MDLKRIAKDTAQVLSSYLTYQALQTVLGQLREMDPPQAYWLNAFSSRANIQDGEAYVQALLRERPDLAYRIMTVRQHIADEVAEFLPEMVCTGIQQANMEHRRQHLERITQLSLSDSQLARESEDDSDSGTEPNLDNLSN